MYITILLCITLYYWNTSSAVGRNEACKWTSFLQAHMQRMIKILKFRSWKVNQHLTTQQSFDKSLAFLQRKGRGEYASWLHATKKWKRYSNLDDSAIFIYIQLLEVPGHLSVESNCSGSYCCSRDLGYVATPKGAAISKSVWLLQKKNDKQHERYAFFR